MSQRGVLGLFVVALLVAACAVSLVHAAELGTAACGPVQGWGPTKTDTGSLASLLLDLAAIPLGLVSPPAPIPICAAGLPEPLDWLPGDSLAAPITSRAPPIA